MKASSAVLILSQQPSVVVGIAPQLFVLAVLSGMIPVALSVVVDIGGGFAMLAGIPIIVGAWAFFWLRTRQDHHIDRVWFVAPRFWFRGRRLVRRPGRYRQLVSGEQPHVG